MEAFAGLPALEVPARPSLDAAGLGLRASASPPDAAVAKAAAAACFHHDAAPDVTAVAPPERRRGAPRVAPPPRYDTRAAAAAADGQQEAAPRRTTRTAPLIPPSKPKRRFGELRCIDESHRHNCTSCTAPPELEMESAYMLLGADGKKNGEKRLRRLLVRTAEWKNEAQRASVISACNTPRLEALARVFRGEANCSELRKAHVLYLARAWRYKSDLWVLRKRGASDGGSDVSAEDPVPAAQRPAQRRRLAAAIAPLAEEGEDDAADADEELPLDWARVTPPSPPALLDGGDGSDSGGAVRREARTRARAPASLASPAAAGVKLARPGLISPGGVAAARALTSAKRGGGGGAAASVPARALQLPPTGGPGVTVADVAAAMSATLLPLATCCGTLLSGQLARAACAAAPPAGAALGAGAEFISPGVLQEVRLAAAGWKALHADLRRGLEPQRAWASQVASPSGGVARPRGGGASGGPQRRVSPRRIAAQDGAAPAWSTLLGRELPMEGLVRQVLSLVGSSAAFTRRRDADARTHGVTEVEAAWLDEIGQAHATMLMLCTHVQGATALLEAMLAGARAASDGWAARAEWLAAALAERQRRALPDEAAAVRAASASRPLLLLAFGGASYMPLQFVAAGSEDAPGGGAGAAGAA